MGIGKQFEFEKTGRIMPEHETVRRWPKPDPNREIADIGYSYVRLVENAMANAKPRLAGDSERWVAIMDTFATGRTKAFELCKFFGLDPHEIVNGVCCISCNP